MSPLRNKTKAHLHNTTQLTPVTRIKLAPSTTSPRAFQQHREHSILLPTTDPNRGLPRHPHHRLTSSAIQLRLIMAYPASSQCPVGSSKTPSISSRQPRLLAPRSNHIIRRSHNNRTINSTSNVNSNSRKSNSHSRRRRRRRRRSSHPLMLLGLRVEEVSCQVQLDVRRLPLRTEHQGPRKPLLHR